MRQNYLANDSGRKRVREIVIVAAVILLSILLPGYIAQGEVLILAIGLVPVLAFTAFLIWKPPAGILALVVGALLVPLDIATGTGTSIPAAMLLVPLLTVLWLLEMGLRDRRIWLKKDRVFSLLLLFIFFALLSFLFGQLPWYELARAPLLAQLGGLAVLVLSPVAFIITAHRLDDYWLRRLVTLFLAVGALYIASRFAPVLGDLIQAIFTEGVGGSVIWIMIVSLSAALAFWNNELSPPQRLALLLFAVTTLLAATRTASWASGWFPATIALLALIWLRWPRAGLLPVFVAAMLAIFNATTIFQTVSDNDSWLARRQAWQLTAEAARVNPLLGVGPANYHFYVEQFMISGWGGFWNVRFNSHNNYVDLYAQLGLVGLGLFLGFAALVLWRAWTINQQSSPGFAKAYAGGLLGATIGVLASGMLGDWFLPFVYNVGLRGLRASILFWIFAGGLFALGTLPNKPQPLRPLKHAPLEDVAIGENPNA